MDEASAGLGQAGAWPVKIPWVFATGLGIGLFSTYGQRPAVAQTALETYLPALYSFEEQAYGGSPYLMLFPNSGTVVTVPLPLIPGRFFYSQDGKALYATARSGPLATSKAGILKITFNPVRASLLPGSESFGIVSFVVLAEEEKVIISGNYAQGKSVESGIFELDPAAGKTRTLFLQQRSPVDYLGAWTYLSVTPDGKRATAMRNGALELIDLTRGTVQPLGAGLITGSWSPDGKWLAVVDPKKHRTMLMDGTTLAVRHSLPESEAIWSPDSQFILGITGSTLCGPYSGTLKIIDISTQKSTTIWSSRCKVNRNTIGWLSGHVSN